MQTDAGPTIVNTGLVLGDLSAAVSGTTELV